jgi:hypothetical protein
LEFAIQAYGDILFQHNFYYTNIYIYRKILLFKKEIVLFGLLLISIVFSLSSIGKLPGILLFERTDAQPSIDSVLTGGQNQTTSEEVFIVQNTSMSAPAPVRHPGQPPHEVVFALPLRDDGKIGSGKVSFTASKPIEAEILHMYSLQQPIDESHGEPYHAVLPGNRSIAISHLRDIVDVPIEINGTGISSGSFEFAGSALVFHKTNGEPFTVAYTIDAVAKDMTR